MRFLKVPNAIFSYGLAPNAMKVYTYLFACSNTLGTATVRIGTIQRHCRIASPATVRTALAELEQKRLIFAIRRRGAGGRDISNRFTVKRLGGAWFQLWMDCAPFSLDKSAFAVYLYLCRQRIRYSGKACPSQNAIACALGLARHTVNDAIQRLAQLGVILKGSFWHGKHNIYRVLMQCMTAPQEKAAKKEMPPQQQSAATDIGHPKGSQPIFTIIHNLSIVKKSFFKMGCAIFNHQYIDVTYTPKKKKKNITSSNDMGKRRTIGLVRLFTARIKDTVRRRSRRKAGVGTTFFSWHRRI